MKTFKPKHSFFFLSAPCMGKLIGKFVYSLLWHSLEVWATQTPASVGKYLAPLCTTLKPQASCSSLLSQAIFWPLGNMPLFSPQSLIIRVRHFIFFWCMCSLYCKPNFAWEIYSASVGDHSILFICINHITRLKMHYLKIVFHSKLLWCQRIQVCSACMSSRVSQGQVPLLSTIMNTKLVFISFSTWKILQNKYLKITEYYLLGKKQKSFTDSYILKWMTKYDILKHKASPTQTVKQNENDFRK